MLYQVLTIFALILGATWPVTQLIRYLIGPNLKIKLTRDLFFRYMDDGECFFLRPILLAERGNILINKIEGHLSFTRQGADKTFKIQFINFGHLIQNPNQVLPDHFFLSKGPTNVLIKDSPFWAVYLSRLEKYGDKMQQQYRDWMQDLIKLIPAVPFSPSPSDQEKEKINGIKNNLKKISEDYANKIFQLVQLEEGEYKIKIWVSFKSLDSILKKERVSTSNTLKFFIGNDLKQNLEKRIERYLFEKGEAALLNRNTAVSSVEYNPISIEEIE